MSNTAADPELTQMDLDAIREVANIGTGQASMALSAMFNQRVDIGLPKTSIIKLTEIGKILDSPDALIGIYSRVKEGLFGNILLIMPVASALNLTNTLHNKSTTRLEDEDIRVLEKVGSVLNSCYLTGVSQLLDQRIIFHSPNVVSIFGNTIADFLAVSVSDNAKVMLVNIDFTIKEFKVSGVFMLLLTIDSLYPLLKKLKQKLMVND